jgi:hypothetical protein
VDFYGPRTLNAIYIGVDKERQVYRHTKETFSASSGEENSSTHASLHDARRKLWHEPPVFRQSSGKNYYLRHILPQRLERLERFEQLEQSFLI